MTDAPMPLQVAIERCFPHGGATVSTLRAAIRAGALRCRLVGRNYLVTQSDINAWMDKCQDIAKGRVSTSDAGRAARQSMSSETERKKLALASALAATSKLLQNSTASARKQDN